MITSEILKYLFSVSITVLGAVVSVRLALRRFYSEKWWEKKANSYTFIIESLVSMKAYYGAKLDCIESSRVSDDQKEIELEKHHSKAKNDINRYLQMGQFTISPEAYSELARLNRALNRESDHSDAHTAVEENFLCVKDSLNKFTQIAIRDLRIDDGKFSVNMIRGLNRAWIFCSIIWLVSVGLLWVRDIREEMRCIAAVKEANINNKSWHYINDALNCNQFIDLAFLNLHIEEYVWTIAAPFGVWLLGAGIFWVLRGFHHDS